jgi:hypothetical protein
MRGWNGAVREGGMEREGRNGTEPYPRGMPATSRVPGARPSAGAHQTGEDLTGPAAGPARAAHGRRATVSTAGLTGASGGRTGRSSVNRAPRPTPSLCTNSAPPSSRAVSDAL